MNDPKLGMIIDGQAGRDAIHVAIMPATAGERLYPGQRIGMFGGKATSQGPHLGIVDPYLTGAVFPDQRFYLCLFPGSITSLRHHWEHPALREDTGAVATPEHDSERAASERWLRDYAEELGLTYDDLMRGAEEYVNTGEYLHRGSLLQDGTAYEFWGHYRAATGKGIPVDTRENFFTCSC